MTARLAKKFVSAAAGMFQICAAAVGVRVSEQFLNSTSAQYRLYSAILLKLRRN